MRPNLVSVRVNWEMGCALMTKAKLVKILVCVEIVLCALLIWVAFL